MSPFLFALVVGILIATARQSVAKETGAEPAAEYGPSELLHADDALILAVEVGPLSAHLSAIASAGAEFGLRLNWSKVELLPVRGVGGLQLRNGTMLQAKPSIKYFGGHFGQRRLACCRTLSAVTYSPLKSPTHLTGRRTGGGRHQITDKNRSDLYHYQ